MIPLPYRRENGGRAVLRRDLQGQDLNPCVHTPVNDCPVNDSGSHSGASMHPRTDVSL